jgi:hypothetical protein
VIGRVTTYCLSSAGGSVNSSAFLVVVWKSGFVCTICGRRGADVRPLLNRHVGNRRLGQTPSDAGANVGWSATAIREQMIGPIHR